MTWNGTQDLHYDDIKFSFSFTTNKGEIYCPNIIDVTVQDTIDNPSITTIEGDIIAKISGNLCVEEGEVIESIVISSESSQGAWTGTLDVAIYNSDIQELEEFSASNFPSDGGSKYIGLDYPISTGTTDIALLLNNW